MSTVIRNNCINHANNADKYYYSKLNLPLKVVIEFTNDHHNDYDAIQGILLLIMFSLFRSNNILLLYFNYGYRSNRKSSYDWNA